MQRNLEQSLDPLQARPLPSRGNALLNNLRVGQKLALAASLFSLPVAGLTYLVVSQQQQDISTLQLESQGVPYISAANSLQEQLQQYARAAILARQSGDAAALQAQAGKVSDSLAAYGKLVNSDSGLYANGGQLAKLQTAWAELQGGATSLLPSQIVEKTSSIGDDLLLSGIDQVSTATGLELDTRVDTFFLQSYVVNQLPDLLLQTDEARLTALQFPHGHPDAAARQAVGTLIGEIGTFVDETEHRYRILEEKAPGLKPELGPRFSALRSAADTYLAALGVFNQGLAVPDLDALAQKMATSVTDFAGSSQGALGRLLAERTGEERQRQLLELLLVGLLLALALGLLLLVARAITRPLGHLASASERLAQGDLAVHVPVTTRDEVGTVSTAFNSAVGQLRRSAEKTEQDRLENEKLQNNIGDFLNITMDIAEGDLTKRGRVTEDVLGNVVDSINVMTEELGQVLRGVQRASQSVTGGSVDMLSTTQDIQVGTQLTASETQRVAAQVQTVIAQLREMAGSAQSSAESARQALLASQQGQVAVTGTLDGMQNIRREVQGVARRIKSLGDRSLEIQEIVDTISQIASQTNLLALNAAIEAAGAGEAGSRFAIVADEVRKLADNSAQATARIASLIRNVQTEIQDVIVSVEDGTREVEQGYRVAGTAGERLREIGQYTQQSAQLAESISSASQVQVQGMEEVGGAVQEIANIADRSRSSVERGRAAAEQLQTLAHQLNTGLARFRLPG